MAYRRFVTYLFRYKNGKKEENCGFAKVEVRQEHARMEIQVRGVPDGTDRVYLFAVVDGTDADGGIGRNESGQRGLVYSNHALEGAYIGNLVVSNGMGRARFTFDSEKIGGTPYGMDDMAGIYIQSAGGFLGSQWVDEELDWGSFREYEVPEEKMMGKNLPEQEEIVTEKEYVTGEEKADHPISQNRAEVENDEQRRDTILQNESERNLGNLPQSTFEQLHATQAATAAVRVELPTQTPRVSSYINAWERQWRKFTDTHPLFCPFDEAPDILAVKMDLRDFKLLPKPYLPLANNSFLLHGYFNYKYLLFGYMDGEPRRWFLGVPGIFQNQEQLLAGLFGFGEFRTKHLTKQKTGEFGYWYRYLEL